MTVEDFATTLEQLRPQLRRKAFKTFFIPSDVADDYLQTTYLHIHRHILSGNRIERKALPNYLRATFNHVCIRNTIPRRSTRKHNLVSLENLSSEPAHHNTPVQKAISQENLDVVMQGIALLPDIDQDIVYLHLAELPRREIGRIKELSLRSVDWSLYRARTQLHAYLKSHLS